MPPAAGCTVGSVVVPGAPLPANSFVHSLAGVFGITVTDAMQATFLFRMFYIWLATSLVRFKYYMAWKLAEGLRFSSRDLFRCADSPAGSCAAAGLGYHLVTMDGKTSDAWDAVSNVDILGVEFGGDLSTVIR